MLPDELELKVRDAGDVAEGAPLGDASFESVAAALVETERSGVALTAPLALGALPVAIALADLLAPREEVGGGDELTAPVALAASDTVAPPLGHDESLALGEGGTLALGAALRESRGGVGVVEGDAEASCDDEVTQDWVVALPDGVKLARTLTLANDAL